MQSELEALIDLAVKASDHNQLIDYSFWNLSTAD